MRYVLDTNVVAGLMRGDAPVLARFERAARRAILVPQPVWAELAYGIERLPPSKRKQRLDARARLLREELESPPWTWEVSRAFGSLKASLEARGERLDDLDVAIAAHALALGAVLVTANVKHLGRIEELVVEDWTT